MLLRGSRKPRSGRTLTRIEIESQYSLKKNRTLPKIEIYNSESCPFCRGTIRLLKDEGVEFALYSIDGDLRKRREITARGSDHSVPQIFMGQRPIGGFDELTALIFNGELDSLLGLGRRHSG